MRLPALCLALLSAAAFAAEPFLKPNDVIALVGGEDMVVAGELGYLELLLTRALPGHRLKFRTLAWEGDTVFEQRRDLNFPPLEKQLDEIGATVVLCQFGQMESLRADATPAQFRDALTALGLRLAGDGTKTARRVAIIPPHEFEPTAKLPNVAARNIRLQEFRQQARGASFDAKARWISLGLSWAEGKPWPRAQSDGIHYNPRGQSYMAGDIARGLGVEEALKLKLFVMSRGDTIYRDEGKGSVKPGPDEALRQLITAKNRLWFDYWRVENWAFLAGDRTSQPSSRDHLDKDKRWFPAERARFLPLIDAREKEIWAAAAKLAQP